MEHVSNLVTFPSHDHVVKHLLVFFFFFDFFSTLPFSQIIKITLSHGEVEGIIRTNSIRKVWLGKVIKSIQNILNVVFNFIFFFFLL
jgi:hypothetical protein